MAKIRLVKKKTNEMSGTGGSASATPGTGAQYAAPKAFPKVAADYNKTFGTHFAPSIPNRPSKAITYKEMWEEYDEFDMEDAGPDYNNVSDLEDELRRLTRWSNQYGSKGADAQMDQLRKRIEYLKVQSTSVNEAINPEVFREFMQACSDAGLNSFQIFGMHVLVYILTLGATGAAILSALGIAQLAKDAKDAFNDWNDGRKLNPQKVKAIVQDFENKVSKLEGGRKKFFQGIINKMKRTNPEDKSSLVSINKDLTYYADRYNLNNEPVNENTDMVVAILNNPNLDPDVKKLLFKGYRDGHLTADKVVKMVQNLLMTRESTDDADFDSATTGAQGLQTTNPLPIKEGHYSEFKRTTQVRTPSEQMHRAVREIRRKIDEINKLVDYTEKMKSEMKSDVNEVRYLNRTKEALSKISAKVQETNNKIKRLVQ